MADGSINKLDRDECAKKLAKLEEVRNSARASMLEYAKTIMALATEQDGDYPYHAITAIGLGSKRLHTVEKAWLDSMNAQLAAQGDEPVLASIGETEEP